MAMSRSQRSAQLISSTAGRSFLHRLLPKRENSTLSFEEVEVPPADGSKEGSSHTAMLVHGLMGSGRNWRTFAKKLASTLVNRSANPAPGWKMVLVDLRNHGLSAALDFDPPHDIAAAARDLAGLIKAHPSVQPDVIVGHSLGGKIALDFILNSAKKAYGDQVSLPKQAWILDSPPGEVHGDKADGEVEHVLEAIQRLPLPIPSRRWLVEHMTHLGFSKSLSDWLGTNLRRINASSEESAWVFNLNGVQDMFQSYRKQSYWSLLENPPPGIEIGNVRAAKSDRWRPDTVIRLEQLNSKSERKNADSGIISYHVLPNAGHWVHVDNPDGLIEILVPRLLQLAS